MRQDFDNLQDGERVMLHPNGSNPLHQRPIIAMHQSGYFYCEGTDPMEGPDYYLGDVLAYNDGFEIIT